VSESALLVARDGPIARLTLNRPAHRNALSRELLSALGRALRDCSASEDVRVAIIAGNGPAFSAGHDLRELRERTSQRAAELFRECAEVMIGIQELAIPVIALVHGMATAAGCQLVAACDLALASEEARFATPGVNIGLFCSTPAVPLVRAIGRKRALEMLLTGAPIDAPTALEWGLINRIVPAEQLEAAADELARQIAAASRSTIALGKRAFYEQVSLADRTAYATSSAAMVECAASADAVEGIEAFLSHRPPRWRG
jgi:enoyl-CoA hydratase/carnithine racemase